jgi:hypothetical protein
MLGVGHRRAVRATERGHQRLGRRPGEDRAAEELDRARVGDRAPRARVEEEQPVGGIGEDRVRLRAVDLRRGARARLADGRARAGRQELDGRLVVLGELVAVELVRQVEVADHDAGEADGDAEEGLHRRVMGREAAERRVLSQVAHAHRAIFVRDEPEEPDRARGVADHPGELGGDAREHPRLEGDVGARLEADRGIAGARDEPRLLRDDGEHGAQLEARRPERLREGGVGAGEGVELRPEPLRHAGRLPEHERAAEDVGDDAHGGELLAVEAVRFGPRVREHAREAAEREERQRHDGPGPAKDLLVGLGERGIDRRDVLDDLLRASGRGARREERGVEADARSARGAVRREAAMGEQRELAAGLGRLVHLGQASAVACEDLVEQEVDDPPDVALLRGRPGEPRDELDADARRGGRGGSSAGGARRVQRSGGHPPDAGAGRGRRHRHRA